MGDKLDVQQRTLALMILRPSTCAVPYGCGIARRITETS